MNSKNNKISKTLRHIVFERDSYTCIYCDNGATDVHHVFDNRNIVYNLVSICRRCHMVLHGQLEELYENMRNDMYGAMVEYLWHAHPNELEEWLRE